MFSRSWPIVSVITDSGEQKPAIAPSIISASRSTDIPALYGAWLLRRLEAGYVRWINPWSGRPTYVSLEAARLFVFWSKNPQPFLPFLKELDKKKLHYYFHFTLNDYEQEGLERGIPPLRSRIETFKRLAGMLGPERVIWRFDPLLCTGALAPGRLVERVASVGAALVGSTERLTISFLSCYAKVQRNLKNAGITVVPWSDERKAAVARDLSELGRVLNVRVVTCAEQGDYAAFGITHGKCIDNELVERLFGFSEEHLQFQGGGSRGRNPGGPSGSLKDKGQRPLCGCIPSKDIGGYNTCRHQCVYCYANSSPRRGVENNQSAAVDSDAIGL